jgi:hypothetical protein
VRQTSAAFLLSVSGQVSKDLLLRAQDEQTKFFHLASFWILRETKDMKRYAKPLLSILVAAICTSAFAAEPTPQSCKKSGKNCPMNDNKACNCGKKCSC